MPDESGRGAQISAFLHKKTGPLPNGAWIFIAAAVGFYVVSRKRKGKTAAGADATGSGDGGTFSSTTSTTDPATGNQQSYTATGPTSGFLQGGALTTWQAQPMGYSGGDVFVNYPGSTTAPQGPQYPPKNAPAAGSGQTGSWWYTLSKPVGAGELANEVYQLGNNMNAAQTPGAITVMSADLVNIMNANPQIDWTRVTTGDGKLPAGTAIFVPMGGGIAGRVPKLPANASLAAPASYSPPNMTASMQQAVSTVQ